MKVKTLLVCAESRNWLWSYSIVSGCHEHFSTCVCVPRLVTSTRNWRNSIWITQDCSCCAPVVMPLPCLSRVPKDSTRETWDKHKQGPKAGQESRTVWASNGKSELKFGVCMYWRLCMYWWLETAASGRRAQNAPVCNSTMIAVLMWGCSSSGGTEKTSEHDRATEKAWSLTLPNKGCIPFNAKCGMDHSCRWGSRKCVHDNSLTTLGNATSVQTKCVWEEEDLHLQPTK